MKKKINYSKIYSPFKLVLYDKCPKEYHFTYLDPIYSQMKNQLKRQPENIWGFNTLGKAVHNAITLFYHLPEEQRTEKNLLEQLKNTWRSEVMPFEDPPLGKWGGFETTEEERDYYRQAIVMLRNFLKIADSSPSLEYLPTNNFTRSIEDYINLITPLTEDFDISGKFDLITRKGNSLHIIDFKTGKQKDVDYFQLRFYKLLAESKFEKPVKKASLYFLKTANVQGLDFQKQTEEIKKEVIEKINQIKNSKDFPAKPSKLCKFCLFKTFCPKKTAISQKTEDIKEEDFADDLPF